MFEKQEKVEIKICCGKKCALSSSQLRAALKKQTKIIKNKNKK
jgi:hypothetical protein